MTPDFRITANSQDVTATIRDRLIALELVDEDGTKSDRLDLSIDDRDGRVALPPMETTLEVWLGFRGAPLSHMGRYAVDGLSGEGPGQVIDITATAADMKGPIRAPQTRAWEDATLSSIVDKIAAEAGLKPVVAASIAGQAWAYLAQTAESNLHFLTRIAATLDATAKPAGGALVVQKRGEGKSAAGDTLTPPSIDRAQLTAWRWKLDGRETWGAIEAEWCEPGAARRNLVRRGSGQPVRRLRHVHSCEADAVRAAESEMARAGRAAVTISAEIAGFAPALLAGGSVTLTGLRPELNGAWHVTSARHRLGQGLTTTFEARKGQVK